MGREEIFEIMLDYANAQEVAAVNLKHRIAELAGVEGAAVEEEVFAVLKFEPQTGARIGDFEVAYKPNNIPEKFQHAYAILHKNNATIGSRYHGPRYVFAYWLYAQNKIYRQKLKAPKKSS
ncbi:hypothetical protein KAU30_00130 [Candidatus Bathyarchaeota archaeon]|nr:hypothetical protein [Candidatus Bathyarchaeota archaeon]